MDTLNKGVADGGNSSSVSNGPFPRATTNPNPEDAGDEAADEILDEDGQCPTDGCSADKIKRWSIGNINAMF